MRILQVHNKVPYPPKDGGSIAVWNLSLELARQGHEVSLLAMNTIKHHFNLADYPKEYSNLVHLTGIDVPAKISPLKALLNLIFSNKPYNATRFISSDFRKRFLEELKSKEYDLILFEGLYVMPYLDDITGSCSAKKVYRAHNIESEIWTRLAIHETSLLKRTYLRILARRIKKMEDRYIPKADLVMALTRRDADILRSQKGSPPVEVSPAGIPVQEEGNTPVPIAGTCFFLGALDWPPNQEGLIWFLEKILPLMKDRVPSLRFRVAGRNAPDWLRKKLEIPGIEFLGEIDNAKQFMAESGVMIVPILSGSGMRVKIAEGLAWGIPVITTSMGTEGIDSTDGVNILIADSPESFAGKLSTACQNPDLLSKISIQARQFASTHLCIKTITRDFIQRVTAIQ
jgi:glycosyltransferase involved in cell wall biosynthesis